MSSASRNVELVTILNLFRLDMMEIKGKRGRKVPIILTGDETQHWPTNKNKESCRYSRCQHVCLRQSWRQSLDHIRGWIASDNLHLNAILHSLIQMLSRAQNCENTSQLYHKCSHENEVDWLAMHLGHDVMVHREFCFWLWMAAKSASGRENVFMKSTLMVSILKHLLLLNLFFYF